MNDLTHKPTDAFDALQPMERSENATRDNETGQVFNLPDRAEPNPFYDPTQMEAEHSETWQEPLDLLEAQTAPTIHVGDLPDVWKDMIGDAQRVSGFLPEGSFAAILAASAAALDKRITIQPHSNDPTWRERAILWLMIVAAPSSKKSPTLSNLFSGLIGKLKAALAKEAKQAQADYDDARQIYEGRLRKYRKQQVDGLKDGEEALKRPTEPVPPEFRAFTVGDATMEAMGDILSRCPWGLTAEFDELSALIGGMNAYRGGKGRDREDWLQAYGGGRHTIDRIGRGHIEIPNMAIGVIGGIQPDKARDTLRNEVQDGLSQRFMPICTGRAGEPKNIAPSKRAYARYMGSLESLAAIQPAQEASVQLSDGAHEVMTNLRRDVEQMARYCGQGAIENHLHKVAAMAYRTLLVFHAVEAVDQKIDPYAETVSKETAEKVTRLFRSFVIPNILYFRTQILGGAAIQPWIKRVAQDVLKFAGDGKDTIQHREVTRNHKAWSDLSDHERRAVWDTLQAANWVEPLPGKDAQTGFPKSYAISPRLVAELPGRIADDQQRRKAAQKAIMDGLQTRAGRDETKDNAATGGMF